ncbi:DUF2867 domain-containing protein [Streptomyces somaliensis DSM 40738]|uniref:DUF2867 domain-containing protein n=1 Tax=Streptomyces somaliensis (strain ATCC 33201 / DSM 40738 / JCM 12659 / KCTC 9044 / NCTC 11332 / NRRL B-12077 / IP 733) TaxID=1134445 RepID=A0AA44DGZ0_STRE0|nr:DUF2867 domain-containing protein [Streptomyces somaliensis]MCQ0021653.1 DUF2867 domain-containing protein [Streptomyces somaliensis DSM 40738]NKY16637.1 DUF2867 domain-containing protein [Streptomyces somaliensis DSM 40738]
MRLTPEAHTSRPWRIHEIAHDFTLQDVWALPTPGGPDDFPRLLEAIRSDGFPDDSSPSVRFLWAVRQKLGALLGWDGERGAAGARFPSLAERLPADLRERPAEPPPGEPFSGLYMTDGEWAAELANRTVHAVMHLSWVPDGSGGHRGQMAVLVKPNGVLGTAYMAAIAPFRHLLVYPQLMRSWERRWKGLAASGR